MTDYKEITDPSEKSRICDSILRALPNWFGNEAAIVSYSEEVKAMPFYAAYDGITCVGFVAIKIHNEYTAEVCVTGVLEEYHRRGIGRRFINICEDYCRASGMEFLTVKTLDESGGSESYDKTRAFYLSVGFKPLEVFPLHWDADNPCLFMAKRVEGNN